MSKRTVSRCYLQRGTQTHSTCDTVASPTTEVVVETQSKENRKSQSNMTGSHSSTTDMSNEHENELGFEFKLYRPS